MLTFELNHMIDCYELNCQVNWFFPCCLFAEKLDNFILNILRLKSAIRKQLELEGDGEELLDELAEASNEADDQIFHYIDAKSGSRHSGLSPHRLNTASP